MGAEEVSDIYSVCKEIVSDIAVREYLTVDAVRKDRKECVIGVMFFDIGIPIGVVARSSLLGGYVLRTPFYKYSFSENEERKAREKIEELLDSRRDYVLSTLNKVIEKELQNNIYSLPAFGVEIRPNKNKLFVLTVSPTPLLIASAELDVESAEYYLRSHLYRKYVLGEMKYSISLSSYETLSYFVHFRDLSISNTVSLINLVSRYRVDSIESLAEVILERVLATEPEFVRKILSTIREQGERE